MARNPLVQELLDQFVVPNQTTGIRRAIGILYRTLANNMANQLADSSELVRALQLLVESKNQAMVGGLNPRPIPEGAAPRRRGMESGAGAPTVMVDGMVAGASKRRDL